MRKSDTILTIPAPDDSPRWSRRGFLLTGASLAGAAIAAPGLLEAARNSGTERIRVAWIGSRASVRAPAPLLRETALGGAVSNSKVEIAAVCDADALRSADLQKRVELWSGRKVAAFADHRRLLASKSVDAVVCAVPVDRRFEVSRDCINAGAHLYVTLPLARNARELKELVTLQEKHPRLKIQLDLELRSNREYEKAARLVREDRIVGDLLACECQRRDNISMCCDIANWFTGERPERARPVPGSPGAVILEYPCGMELRFADAPTRFVGSAGEITPATGNIVYRSTSFKSARVEKLEGETLDPRRPLQSFFDTIIDDLSPFATIYHGRDATLTALLAGEAAREGREVTWKELEEKRDS